MLRAHHFSASSPLTLPDPPVTVPPPPTRQLKANHFATVAVLPGASAATVRPISFLSLLLSFWSPITLSTITSSSESYLPPTSHPPTHQMLSHHVISSSPLLRFTLPPLFTSFALRLSVTRTHTRADNSNGRSATGKAKAPDGVILYASLLCSGCMSKALSASLSLANMRILQWHTHAQATAGTELTSVR